MAILNMEEPEKARKLSEKGSQKWFHLISDVPLPTPFNIRRWKKNRVNWYTSEGVVKLC